jgi:hypothetical protein
MKDTLSNLTPDERLQLAWYMEYREQKELKDNLYYDLLAKDKLYIKGDTNGRGK